MQNGSILISVHCDTAGEIVRAKEIMLSTGGDHISSSGESMVDTVAFPVADHDHVKH